MTARPHEHHDPPAPLALGGLLLALTRLLLPVALGVGCAYLLLAHVLMHRVPLGEVQRIVELGRHLDTPAPPGWLPFVGDSITRDGIDSAQVQNAAPTGWHIENLGVSGCSPTERQLILPAVLARRPAAVAIGVYPTDLCLAGGLGIDEAYAYAHAGFAAHWAGEQLPGDGADLTPARTAALRSTTWRQRLHFRTLLTTWLEDRLRHTLRSDLRTDADSDWIRRCTARACERIWRPYAPTSRAAATPPARSAGAH